MVIFSGSSSSNLGKNIAHELKEELGAIEIERFPDGEIYLKVLSEVKGLECTVVQSTLGNDALIELILTLDLLKDMGASRINTIIPYLGYSRQDKRFSEGEALSSKTILEILDKYSDSITTINCHFLQNEGKADFYGVGINNLDAFPLIAEYFRDRLQDPVLIAPDKGSLDYAKNASEIIDCEFDFLEKKRISGDEVIIKTKHLSVKGRDVLIIDDMISTGGTIMESAKLLRKEGAMTVNVGCVHGIFSNGVEKIRSSVDSLVCTDTIERDISKVSVSNLIAEKLR